MNSEKPAVPLDPLDPGYEDPTFWLRFQDRVMRAAVPELARRRWSHGLTVSDVVLSWGRLVVPAAVAAAIAGSFFLVRADAVPLPSQFDAIEELLVAEADDLPFLKADEPPDAAQILVAVERR